MEYNDEIGRFKHKLSKDTLTLWDGADAADYRANFESNLYFLSEKWKCPEIFLRKIQAGDHRAF